MEDEALIERLLYSGEGDTLDFKLQQFPFENADDKSKSSLLKDILAFANAWRATTAYILVGVRDGTGEIVGLDKNIDDSRIQQFVNSKVNRPIQFSYRSLKFKGHTLGLYTFPVQERPIFAVKRFGNVEANTVYVRRGSATDEAKPDEVAKMGAAAAALAHLDKVPKLSILIGMDGRYVDVHQYNTINITKTVRIGVKNAGNTYLTNCRVSFQATGTKAETPERWLCMDAFSLNPGEEKLVNLAMYGEPILLEQPGLDWITLAAPPSGNFWSAPKISKDGGAVTVIATSLESAPCEAICRLWVCDGKLQWEAV